MFMEPTPDVGIASGNIQQRFESAIQQERYAWLSKHRFGKLRIIDWDALHGFRLVDDVEQLLNVGAW